MVQLSPDLYFVLYFVEVVNHLHFSVGVVPDSSLAFERWLMHNLHSELSEFNVFVLDLVVVWGAYGPSNNSFYLRKSPFSN